MPREIITLQLGQCGNQSERATAVAGPGERAPGGVGMLWGGPVSGAWRDGAGLQASGAGPADRGAPGPAPAPVPIPLPGPSDRASPQSGSSSGSSSAPSTASAPRASWKSSPPRAPTARTSSFTRYRPPQAVERGTRREVCCPSPRGAPCPGRCSWAVCARAAHSTAPAGTGTVGRALTVQVGAAAELRLLLIARSGLPPALPVCSWSAVEAEQRHEAVAAIHSVLCKHQESPPPALGALWGTETLL